MGLMLLRQSFFFGDSVWFGSFLEYYFAYLMILSTFVYSLTK